MSNTCTGTIWKYSVKNITQTAVVVEIEVHFFGNDGKCRDARLGILRLSRVLVVAKYNWSHYCVGCWMTSMVFDSEHTGTEYRNKRSKALLRVAQVVAEHDGAHFAIFASLLGIPADEKTTRIDNEDEAMTTMQQQLNLDTA